MAKLQTGLPVDAIADRFKLWALGETHELSPLYERISLAAAEDPELLNLVTEVREGQPPPNLLFGAVHLLLLKGEAHPLADFYPSISASPSALEDPYPAFRSFCMEHEGEIREIVGNRLVQTNVIRRCAYLMPAFCHVAHRNKGRPLSLIEIGASAGLNMNWDRYTYVYGEAEPFGDVNSPVRITSALLGLRRPMIPECLPGVAFRVGLDLNPINLHNEEEVLWLRALIWPEERDRVPLFESAIKLAKDYLPNVIGGDAVDLLPDVLNDVSPYTTLCIYATHTLNQFPHERREQLYSIIDRFGSDRNVYLVTSQKRSHYPPPRLKLTSYEGGTKTETLLGYCNGHGRWLEWLQDG